MSHSRIYLVSSHSVPLLSHRLLQPRKLKLIPLRDLYDNSRSVWPMLSVCLLVAIGSSLWELGAHCANVKQANAIIDLIGIQEEICMINILITSHSETLPIAQDLKSYEHKHI